MRKIGYEFEFAHLNRVNLEEIITSRGFRFTRGREDKRHWNLKSEHCGKELTTHAFQATDNNFTKVRNILEDIRAVVRGTQCINRGCGMHMHVNVSNKRHLPNIIKLFRSYENALLSLQPHSRSNNGFVNLLRNCNNYINEPLNCNSPYRRHYTAVNVNKYHTRNRPSIEIRYGAATVRGRKAINWGQLMVLMVEIAEKIPDIEVQTDKTLDDLINLINEVQTDTWLDDRKRNLGIWMRRRQDRLANNNSNRRRSS